MSEKKHGPDGDLMDAGSLPGSQCPDGIGLGGVTQDSGGALRSSARVHPLWEEGDGSWPPG